LARTSEGSRDAPGLDDLEEALPSLERAVRKGRFNPKIESSHFRIATTDEVCGQFVASLCCNFVNNAHRVKVDCVSLPARPLELLESGKVDLLLAPSERMLPSAAEKEQLYREGWICAAWSDSAFGERLTLKQYEKAEHVVVSARAHFHTDLDERLWHHKVRRNPRVRLPYYGAALACLPGTALVLTLPYSMRPLVKGDPKLRLIGAPKELAPMEVWMAWHSRLNDDARHVWLLERMRAAHPAKCLPRSVDQWGIILPAFGPQRVES
jgi:DNA-binding transcriptional LysR family regulator